MPGRIRAYVGRQPLDQAASPALPLGAGIQNFELREGSSNTQPDHASPDPTRKRNDGHRRGGEASPRP